jgi:hypothetical protein
VSFGRGDAVAVTVLSSTQDELEVAGNGDFHRRRSWRRRVAEMNERGIGEGIRSKRRWNSRA